MRNWHTGIPEGIRVLNYNEQMIENTEVRKSDNVTVRHNKVNEYRL